MLASHRHRHADMCTAWDSVAAAHAPPLTGAAGPAATVTKHAHTPRGGRPAMDRTHLQLAVIVVICLAASGIVGGEPDPCSAFECSADCGVGLDLDDCGWDSESNQCRTGFFTVSTEEEALLEAAPGACNHHRPGRRSKNLGTTSSAPPSSHRATKSNGPKGAKSSTETRGSSPRLRTAPVDTAEAKKPIRTPTPPPTPIAEEPDDDDQYDWNEDDDDQYDWNEEEDDEDEDDQYDWNEDDDDARTAADAASGSHQSTSTTLHHGEGEKDLEAVISLDRIGRTATLAQVLLQYHQSLSIELEREPVPGQQAGDENGPSPLQLFHIALIKGSTTEAWRGAGKSNKKARGKSASVQNSMPTSVTSDFKSRYGDTDFMATMFPSQSDGTKRSAVEFADECRAAAASSETGAMLNRLIRQHKMQLTVEVGFACGYSAASCAIAHRDLAKGGKYAGTHLHIAVDPAAQKTGIEELQNTGYGGMGIKAIQRLGLSAYFELREQPSHEALPDLLKIHGPGSVQLIFIDGMHLFDYVMMEIYFADKLLSVRGFLVFDDAQMPAVQQAILYVTQNRHYSVVPTVHIEPRCVVLKKTSDDNREWFDHRPF